MSFITASSYQGKEIVTINGNGIDAKRTRIDGDSVVKLSSARQEESGFNWNGRKVDEVVISHVLIYDDLDIRCLAWFITSHIKIDLSHSLVSSIALDSLNKLCVDFAARNIKVQAGSSIYLPSPGGYSGMGRSSTTQLHCESIGFKATIGP